MEFYQVKSGDTLSIIARDVLNDINRWPDLAKLNNIAAPYTIFPGMSLMLPDTEVLGPVVVPKIDERGEPTPTPAGIAALLSGPNAWIWVATAAVVFLALLNPRRG